MILIKIILIAIVSFVLQLFFPWWTITIGIFILSFMLSSKKGNSFVSGFIGVALLWFAYAFLLDMENDSILSQKVAELFYLPNSILLILVTAIIGGLVGGFSALSGHSFYQIFFKTKKRNSY